MFVDTLAELRKDGTALEEFSPSEKYGSNERLFLPLDSELSAKHRVVYETAHKMAMRLISAIQSRKDLNSISKNLLKSECKTAGLKVSEESGILFPEDGSEFGFLMLLDRRRYTVTLKNQRHMRRPVAILLKERIKVWPAFFGSPRQHPFQSLHQIDMI